MCVHVAKSDSANKRKESAETPKPKRTCSAVGGRRCKICCVEWEHWVHAQISTLYHVTPSLSNLHMFWSPIVRSPRLCPAEPGRVCRTKKGIVTQNKVLWCAVTWFRRRRLWHLCHHHAGAKAVLASQGCLLFAKVCGPSIVFKGVHHPRAWNRQLAYIKRPKSGAGRGIIRCITIPREKKIFFSP